MKTQELLDHIAGPMLDDRAELLSGVSDQLFKDSTVIRYLNEAERRLCRDAWVLEDFSTGAICEVELSAAKRDYKLHESILHVKSARLSDSDVDLVRVGYDDNRLLPSHTDPDVWDVNAPVTLTPGRPSHYSVDMGTKVFRVLQLPDAATAELKLRLTVVRMPLVPMSEDDPDKEPEVSEEHHLNLAMFAAGSCLANTADIDAELRSLGRQWVNDFNNILVKAKRDRVRFQQSAPQVRFGGWARGCD